MQSQQPSGCSHTIIVVLSFVGMLTALAWKIYLGEHHRIREWAAICLLSLFFSAGMLYWLYPRFPNEYGKLIIVSMVAGAGTTIYFSGFVQAGQWGVRKFIKIIEAIESDSGINGRKK